MGSLRESDIYQCALILVRRVEGCPIDYAADREASARAASRLLEAESWAKIGQSVRDILGDGPPAGRTIHAGNDAPSRA